MLLLAAMLSLVCSVPALAEVIRDFDVSVKLERDCSLDVTENITVDFEDSQRHGIYRMIPVRFERYGNAYSTPLKILSVTDELGNKRPYNETHQGDDINIKIGDPDTLVTGINKYRIHYVVRRAVNFFAGAPEVYWNATGNQWPYPIEKAEVRFYPPEGVSLGDVKATCYIGVQGSHENGKTEQKGDHILYFATNLEAGSGITIVAGLPQGSVIRPSVWQEFLAWLSDWWPLIVLPLCASTFMWQCFHGARDPKQQAISVEWNPPKDLSPAEVGTLTDQSCDMKDIVATLIDLAARGYLKIKEVPVNGFLFFSSKDYLFIRSEKPASGLKSHEYLFLNGLFDYNKQEMHLSDLKYKFYTHLPSIRDGIYNSLASGKYFRENPASVRHCYRFAAFALAVIGIFVAIKTSTSWGFGALVSAIIIYFSSGQMAARTANGWKAMYECLGFQRFVKMAEADRIRVLAKDDPTIFGRLLAYAMVLGVADEWATKFQDLLTHPPDWYEPIGMGPNYHFYPNVFVNDLGSGMNTMGNTFASTPPSSSSSGGGGGFSGFSGGFSGGGFGGGGGGSW